MKGTTGWICKGLGREKRSILILSLLQMLLGGCGVVYALFLREIVDSAVDGSTKGFAVFTILFCLLVLFRIFLNALIKQYTESTRSNVENRFKARLLDNIYRKDYSRISALHSGDWLNRLTGDTTIIANGCTDIIPGILGMSVKFLGAFIMILIIDIRLALIMIPMGAVLGSVTFLLRKKLKAMHKDVQEKDGKVRIFMQETIESLILIKSYSVYDEMNSDASSRMKDHKDSRMKRNGMQVLAGIGYSLAMNGMFVLGVLYGGLGILNGTMTYGTLMALTQLITQLQSPIVSLTGLIPRCFTVSASAERLMYAETLPDDANNGGSDPSVSADCSSRDVISFGLRNVSFRYLPRASADKRAGVDPAGAAADASESIREDDGMPTVLDDFSLSIEKGEHVAFTGMSGCGKSTVLKLLMGIYSPEKGERFVRFSDGSEISTGDRMLFAYVPQGNFLMSGKIRDVVSFSDRSRSGDDDAIWDALETACADSFVRDLPGGLDCILGERGSGLSEGQMQRIAIARAVFSGRPVLLLDEATGSLDVETEKAILEKIRKLEGKTVVTVTHRPAVAGACDRTVAFE